MKDVMLSGKLYVTKDDITLTDAFWWYIGRNKHEFGYLFCEVKQVLDDDVRLINHDKSSPQETFTFAIYGQLHDYTIKELYKFFDEVEIKNEQYMDEYCNPVSYIVLTGLIDHEK